MLPLRDLGTSPGVSVLLPVLLNAGDHNGAEALIAAIESIGQQEFPGEYEVIVIDDGSTLDLSTLLAGLANSALRIVRLPVNRGIVSALNLGLMHAKKPLVARLDADDLWRPGKISAQLASFIADRDLTISATGMTMVGPNGRRDDVIRPGTWNAILDFFVASGCPFPHGSVVARTDVYKLLGGYPHDPRYRHCEDYALWGTWLRFFKPQMLERSFYEYTVRAGSISSQHRAQQLRATAAVLQEFEQLDLVTVLPAALGSLADSLRTSVVEAGVVAYCMWRFGACVLLPEDAVVSLRTILPDRAFCISNSVGAHSLSRLLGRSSINHGSQPLRSWMAC